MADLILSGMTFSGGMTITLPPMSATTATDTYFKYTTLLLSGNGTNNATNSTFLDSSTNNFTITRNGNTTQGSFSPYGDNWSNYFDGNGDYLTTNMTGLTFGTGDFTVEFWINPSSTASSNIIDTRITSSGPGSWSVEFDGTNLYWTTNGTNYLNVPVSNFPVGVWTHVAYTRVNAIMKVYVNGTQYGSTATVSGNYTSSRFDIGALLRGTWYTGYISNLHLVKGSAVYTSNFTPSTTPLTAVSGTVLLTCQSNRFIDNSTNALTITKNGDVSVQRFSPFSPSAAYSTSTIGGSAYFDGSGDYLTVPSNAALVFGAGDFTIEAWVNASSYTGSGSNYIAATSLASGDTTWGLEFYGGNIRFRVWSSILLTATQPILSSWNHIAISRSGTTLSMFINGNIVATTTNSTNFSATNTLVVGDYNPAAGANFNGYISNLRLVKGTAVYTSTFTPPTAPLSAISGTSLLCNFTNAGIYDATMMNDLETVGDAKISTTQSKFGGSSMYFDGNDNLSVPLNTALMSFGTGDFTIEGWVYHLDSNTYSGYYYGGTNGLVLRRTDANKLEISHDGVASIIVSTTSIPSNQWVFVTGTRSGSTVRIFIDGTVAGTATYATSIVGTSAATIGSIINVAGYYMNGYIDDLRITKGYARYTSNFTPPTAALETQ